MNNLVRRFEFNDGKSSKFWEIEVAGAQFTVRYGKIGTVGQTQTKDFADAATAGKAADKLIVEKIGKGYQEVGVAATTTASAPEASAPAPAKKAGKPKATSTPKPSDLAKDPDTDPTALEALAGSSEAVDRLLARNPKASASLLEKLSHSSDKATRNHVVMHPNAPKDVLVKLAHQFPADFFRNPAFDWMLIEDPDLMQRIGGNVLGSLLKRPDCPQSFLNWAVKHGTEKERLSVAMNPEASVEALRELVSQGGEVAEAAKAHEKLGAGPTIDDPRAALEDEVKKELGQISGEDALSAWKKGLIGAAQWPLLSVTARLECLMIDPALLLSFWLVHNKGRLPTAEPDPDIRAMLAAVTDDISALSQLAADPSIAVRHAAARNALTPVDCIKALACDVDNEIRLSIAEERRDCPREVLALLSADDSFRVRWAVAVHDGCPEDVLHVLSKDGDSEVRQAVAMNANVPSSILEELASDNEAWVRQAVASHPNCPPSLLATWSEVESIRSSVAHNPSCPADLLAMFAKSDDAYLRLSVAGNSSCPESLRLELLRSLAEDSSDYVRKSVAEHVQCPVTILEKLAKDSDSEVREAVIRNPAFTIVVGSIAKERGTEKLMALGKRNGLSEADRALIFSTLMKRAGENAYGALSCEPNCPRDLRIQMEASLIRGTYEAIAKKHKSDQVLRTVLESDRAEDLTAFMAREAEALVIRPSESLLGRLIGVSVPCSPLSSGASVADSLAGSSQIAQRLIGLANKNTSPAILAKRSKSSDWRDRLAIATNSSCPPGTRKKLLADPNVLVAKGAEIGVQTASSVESDRSLVLSSDSQLDQSILIKAVSQKLEEKWDLGESNLIGDLIRSTWQRVLSPSQIFPIASISDRHFPRELLATLGRSKNWKVREQVGMNPACPSEVLDSLASDKEKKVRWAVALNPSCPSFAFRNLVTDQNLVLEYGHYVFGNQNCPADILEASARNSQGNESWFDNRQYVASNPACPLSLLELLASDEDRDVRYGVASNPACPLSLIQVLANDEERDVRYGVAENPITPVAIIEALAGDPESEIRAAAGSNPSCSAVALSRLAQDDDVDVRASVSGNPNCPSSDLHVLARELASKGTIAGNPACPSEILEELSRDEDRYVRQLVAQNSACPATLLAILVLDTDSNVSQAARLNLAYPSGLLEASIEDGGPWTVWQMIHHPNATGEQLTRWARSPRLHPMLRLACVERPQFPISEKVLAEEILRLAEMPPQVPGKVTGDELCLAFQALGLYPEEKKEVAKAAKAKDWLQRAAATFSPDIQPNQLKLLLEDSEEIVRQLAADRLRLREAAKA